MVAAASSVAAPLPVSTLADLLRTLSDEIISSRLEDPQAFDPQTRLAQAAPLFAGLYSVNRLSLLVAKECRSRTAEARLEMDSAHSRLQVRLLNSLRTTGELC